MNKSVMLLIVLTVLPLSGCVLDEYLDKAKDDDNDVSIVEDSLPSPISGTTHNWHRETQNHAAGTTDTLSFSQSITGPVKIDDHDYYTITESHQMTSRKFCIEDNKIFFLIESNMFPFVGTNQDTPFSTNALFFDFDIFENGEYSILDWGTEIDDFYINYYYNGKFLGFETVVTDKENSYLCPKFRITYDTIFTPKVSGSTKNYQRVETIWFAPGIGFIKKTIAQYEESILTESTVETLVE